MKRWSIVLMIVLLSYLQGHAQFWISFGWNEPHCESCHWMENAIRMTDYQAAEYHKIIHRYGERIEQEACRPYRYWDQVAEKIYRLRMERDRKLQHILSPKQFHLYVDLIRELPTRIHDWRGWFNNPHYPEYHPSNICYRYEDYYWHSRWEYSNKRWSNHFDHNKWFPGKYDRHLTHKNRVSRPNNNYSPNMNHGHPNHNEHWTSNHNNRPEFNKQKGESNKEKSQYNKQDQKRQSNKENYYQRDKNDDRLRKGRTSSSRQQSNSRQNTKRDQSRL